MLLHQSLRNGFCPLKTPIFRNASKNESSISSFSSWFFFIVTYENLLETILRASTLCIYYWFVPYNYLGLAEY